MIPVEVTLWHFTSLPDALDHWQTIIAGVLAFVAGFGTVVATMIIARRQIAASREEADRVIAVTREQTETTVRLERERVLSEDRAFRTMLEAAMTRVLAEVANVTSVPPGIRDAARAISSARNNRRFSIVSFPVAK